MTSQLTLKTCSACFKEDDDARACSRCKAVAYCSKKCQTTDWKAGHKKECKRLASQHSESTRVEMPEMSSVDSDHGIKICKVCLKRTDGVRLCTGCNQVAYCSKCCQRKDWLAGHKDNCTEADASADDTSSTSIRCWFCQKAPINVKTCQRCLSAHYCDAVCQKTDWKQHKARCKQVHDANVDGFASLLFSKRFGGLPRPSSVFMSVNRPNERCYEKIKRAACQSFSSYTIVENFEIVPLEPFFYLTQQYVVLAFISRCHPYINRHSVYLTDSQGLETYVGFYVQKKDSPRVCKDVNPGNFICIPNARFHQFLDGGTGFRLNDQNEFVIFKPSDYSA